MSGIPIWMGCRERRRPSPMGDPQKAGKSMSRHLVLLGDSIFDNAAYVPGGRPAVIDQVRSRLPEGWSATLLARDGSVIDDVHRQLELPADATHLVLSVGGNDVLHQIPILESRWRPSAMRCGYCWTAARIPRRTIAG